MMSLHPRPSRFRGFRAPSRMPSCCENMTTGPETRDTGRKEGCAWSRAGLSFRNESGAGAPPARKRARLALNVAGNQGKMRVESMWRVRECAPLLQDTFGLGDRRRKEDGCPTPRRCLWNKNRRNLAFQFPAIGKHERLSSTAHAPRLRALFPSPCLIRFRPVSRTGMLSRGTRVHSAMPCTSRRLTRWLPAKADRVGGRGAGPLFGEDLLCGGHAPFPLVTESGSGPVTGRFASSRAQEILNQVGQRLAGDGICEISTGLASASADGRHTSDGGCRGPAAPVAEDFFGGLIG